MVGLRGKHPTVPVYECYCVINIDRGVGCGVSGVTGTVYNFRTPTGKGVGVGVVCSLGRCFRCIHRVTPMVGVSGKLCAVFGKENHGVVNVFFVEHHPVHSITGTDTGEGIIPSGVICVCFIRCFGGQLRRDDVFGEIIGSAGEDLSGVIFKDHAVVCGGFPFCGQGLVRDIFPRSVCDPGVGFIKPAQESIALPNRLCGQVIVRVVSQRYLSDGICCTCNGAAAGPPNGDGGSTGSGNGIALNRDVVNLTGLHSIGVGEIQVAAADIIGRDQNIFLPVIKDAVQIQVVGFGGNRYFSVSQRRKGVELLRFAVNGSIKAFRCFRLEDGTVTGYPLCVQCGVIGDYSVERKQVRTGRIGIPACKQIPFFSLRAVGSKAVLLKQADAFDHCAIADEGHLGGKSAFISIQGKIVAVDLEFGVQGDISGFLRNLRYLGLESGIGIPPLEGIARLGGVFQGDGILYGVGRGIGQAVCTAVQLISNIVFYGLPLGSKCLIFRILPGIRYFIALCVIPAEKRVACFGNAGRLDGTVKFHAGGSSVDNRNLC